MEKAALHHIVDTMSISETIKRLKEDGYPIKEIKELFIIERNSYDNVYLQEVDNALNEKK